MSGRRDFLALIGGAAASRTVLPAVAGELLPSTGKHLDSAAPASTLPVVYADYCRHLAAQDLVSARPDEIRDRLIALWGDLSPGIGAEAKWGHDPSLADLTSVNEECDRLGCLCADLEDILTETPAATLDDMVAKLRATINVWERTGDAMNEPDWHEYGATILMRERVNQDENL